MSRRDDVHAENLAAAAVAVQLLAFRSDLAAVGLPAWPPVVDR